MSEDTMNARREAIDECAAKIRAILKRRKPIWHNNAMNGSDGQIEGIERDTLCACLRAVRRVRP